MFNDRIYETKCKKNEKILSKQITGPGIQLCIIVIASDLTEHGINYKVAETVLKLHWECGFMGISRKAQNVFKADFESKMLLRFLIKYKTLLIHLYQKTAKLHLNICMKVL